MNFNIHQNTIFETVHGSQSYGLNTPESDIDIKGFCVPPKEFVFGFAQGFEQKDHWGDEDVIHPESLKSPYADRLQADPPKDKVIYSLSKFMKLAAACNPSIIEVLFTEERFHLYTHPLAEKILACRDEFISQKAYQTFHGYAFSQLKRIKLHRRWLLEPPKQQPIRKDFGLPEEQKLLDATTNGAFNKIFADILEASGLHHEREEFIQTYMKEGEPLFQDWMSNIQALSDRKPEKLQLHADAIAEALNLKSEIMEIIIREKEYAKAIHDWQQYVRWKKNRNPKRAELEAKHGFDTKHGMHLVRLLRMGKEILTGKGVQVFRKFDHDELMAIRTGLWSYEKLEEYAEQERADLKEMVKTSTLKKNPDIKKLNQLCVETYDQFWRLS
ncbi:MAG: putative nucleotidyltransferase [bacterium]|jgi:predicted nucleotidyltransferase